MRIAFYLFAACYFHAAVASAQDMPSASAGDAAYVQTINTRAQKIVASLSLTDSTKFHAVQKAVTAQYMALSRLHTERDASIKRLEASGDSKEVVEPKIKAAQDEAAAKIAVLHKQYVNQLSAHLSEEQVARVKDGMTYNVVNITYAGYLDMLPNLTSEQKTQIMTWLVEAREQAMDAETSDKKHWWFGKYKGRINNYLSAAGYDLKKEGDAWEQRRKEREAAKKSTN